MQNIKSILLLVTKGQHFRLPDLEIFIRLRFGHLLRIFHFDFEKVLSVIHLKIATGANPFPLSFTLFKVGNLYPVTLLNIKLR